MTPQELSAGKPATFQIIFDTHSVNLDFDVAAAAELRDELGNTYGTPTWKGDPPGGHHRKGTLSFSQPLTPSIQQVTITFLNVVYLFNSGLHRYIPI